MHTMQTTVTRRRAAATIGVFGLALTPAIARAQHEHHDAESTPASTPAAGTWSCTAPPTPADMGAVDHGSSHETGEPIEFDQLYIDMMLPHHGSVIALSQAAQPLLTDERLIAMTEAIISTQTVENEQLRTWRTDWYGSPDPDLGDASMTQMLEAMPVSTMEEMMTQMSAENLVASFCASDNPDLTFVELVLPHHQMAVDASVIAIEQAVHPELATFAEEVIAAQQAEIDQLNAIRNELGATPTA